MSIENEKDNVIRVAFGQKKDSAPPPKPAPKSSSERKEKLETFSRYIEEGKVMVTFDARAEGVKVPPSHKGDFQLGLNFSHLFRLDDFDYDEVGVRASLSFSGQPFFCDVPWSSVFLIQSHVTNEAELFQDAVPAELVESSKGVTVLLKHYSANEGRIDELAQRIKTIGENLRGTEVLLDSRTLIDKEQNTLAFMTIWAEVGAARQGRSAIEIAERELKVSEFLDAEPSTSVLEEYVG